MAPLVFSLVRFALVSLQLLFPLMPLKDVPFGSLAKDLGRRNLAIALILIRPIRYGVMPPSLPMTSCGPFYRMREYPNIFIQWQHFGP